MSAIPGRIDNKPITLQGLIDYNKMLQQQIPRMGTGNIMKYVDDYGFAWGKENKLGEMTGSTGVLIGRENNMPAGWESCLFGNHNIVSGGSFVYLLGAFNDGSSSKNSVVLGTSNKISWTGDGGLRYVSILGHQLQANASNQTWLGQYNEPHEDIIFGVGNGSYTPADELNGIVEKTIRQNVFTIDKNQNINIGKDNLLSSEGKNLPNYNNFLIGISNSVSNGHDIFHFGINNKSENNENNNNYLTTTSIIVGFNNISKNDSYKSIILGQENTVQIQGKWSYRDYGGDTAQWESAPIVIGRKLEYNKKQLNNQLILLGQFNDNTVNYENLALVIGGGTFWGVESGGSSMSSWHRANILTLDYDGNLNITGKFISNRKPWGVGMSFDADIVVSSEETITIDQGIYTVYTAAAPSSFPSLVDIIFIPTSRNMDYYWGAINSNSYGHCTLTTNNNQARVYLIKILDIKEE